MTYPRPRRPVVTKFASPLVSKPASLIEPLETRRLLAAIEGNFFLDQDNDGVRDFFEEGQEGVTVFLDANRNRVLDDGEVTTTTDEEGNYRFDDLDPGDYYVGHLFEVEDEAGETQLLAQTTPGLPGRSANFDIEVIFLDDVLTDAEKVSLETAVNKWENVIISELPDVGEVDDLQITVETTDVDGQGGTLAFAGPRAFRSEEAFLPYLGAVTIDIADRSESRALVEIVTHEIGHVLGIGTFWSQFLENQGTDRVSYVGENAVREANTIFGTDVDRIAIEPFVEGHWAEARDFSELFDGTFVPSPSNGLGKELMTPFYDNERIDENGNVVIAEGAPVDADPFSPLSRITIGALEDLGYEVNYGAAEVYQGVGPDLSDFERIDVTPFTVGVRLSSEDQVAEAANFGVRFNEAPNPFFFAAGPEVVAPGQPARLLAEIDTTLDLDFDGDVDFRDEIIQVNFFRETNGVAGLQTPGDVRRGAAETHDVLLFQDVDSSDGFDFAYDTTGLADGETTFYAQAFDQGYFDTVRSDTVVINSTQTELPERPTDLRVLGISTSEFLVEFDDNADDETGYVLQISSEAGFDVPDAIRTVFLPAQEGTGPYSTVYEIPSLADTSNTTRYFRVRAFNTVGNTVFAGRATARTLGVGEVLVDNADTDRVTVDGLEEVADTDNEANATALTYLVGESGSATFRPMFDEPGDYLVFVRSLDIDGLGETFVEIFNGAGELLGSRTLTADDAGSNTLIGTFELDEESFVRLSATGEGLATADTVRFLPTGSDEA